MAKWVVCELGRVAELHEELAREGVASDTPSIQHGGWDADPGIKWVGMEPCPGAVWTLVAPIEGADQPPMWESRGGRWWFTRDLTAFRVE